MAGALAHADTPPAALQQFAYTQPQRKPDVLDKTVTFLAKRDGIDKVLNFVCAVLQLSKARSKHFIALARSC